jgi:hypothetical protein
MRANSAEQSCAIANAQADALRNAPRVAAPSTTIVAIHEHDTDTTPVAEPHHIRPHHIRHRVAHKHVGATHTKTTTT